MPTVEELFEHVPEWKVVICRHCRHAVWPQEVVGHLMGQQHSQSKKEAEAIADIVQSWPGISQYPSEFQVPGFVTASIPQLPLFDNGLQCQLEPQKCCYIARDIKSIRKHWRMCHSWNVSQIQGGRSGTIKQEIVQQRTHEGARQVQCQRFFPSRSHSQYFEVRVDNCTSQDKPDNIDADIWSQAWQQASQQFDEEQNASTIQAGEMDEVNPWLRRTGWIEYLAGCQPKELLQSTREPTCEDIAHASSEPVAAAIWDAIGTVATASQSTVKKSGVTLRFEAVRTEYDRVQYHPLEAYRDPNTVQRHCRPWRQMVMFFVRTQQPHEWKSPPYEFNRRQQRAFERMMECARRCSSASDDEGSSSGEDSSENSDTHSVGSMRPEFTKLREACLRFCIELLNQTMYSHETDMALVCALAVIGVSPKGVGFQSTKSFPSILSAIIKIGHFMVVQQAHIIANNNPGASWETNSSPCDLEDSGYESEGGPRRQKARSSFQWVKRMMREFMVRGTGSPMQWMLDLRAYGMKVDFNTTYNSTNILRWIV